MPKPYQPTSWLPGGRTIAKGPNALELQNESYERRQKLATTKAATTSGLAEVGHSIEIIQAAAPKVPEDLFVSTFTALGGSYNGPRTSIVIPYNNCAYWPLKMGGAATATNWIVLPVVGSGTTATSISINIYAVDYFTPEGLSRRLGLVGKSGTSTGTTNGLVRVPFNFTFQEGVEYYVGICGVDGKVTLGGAEGLQPNIDSYLPRQVYTESWDNDAGSGTNTFDLDVSPAGATTTVSRNSNMHILFQVNHDTGGSERLTAVTQGSVTWTLLFRKWDSNDMITSCWYSTDVADNDVNASAEAVGNLAFPMSDITLTFSTTTIPQGCAVLFDVPNVTGVGSADSRTSTSSPGWNDPNNREAINSTFTAYLNWLTLSRNSDDVRYMQGKVFAEAVSAGTAATAPMMFLAMDNRDEGSEYTYNIYADAGASVKTSYGTIRFTAPVFGSLVQFMVTSQATNYLEVWPSTGLDKPRSCPSTVDFSTSLRNLWGTPAFGVPEIVFSKTAASFITR